MCMISEKFVHLFHVKLSHIHCHFSKTNQIMFVRIVGAGSFVHSHFHWWCWNSPKQVELFTSFFLNLVFVSLSTVFSLDQLTVGMINHLTLFIWKTRKVKIIKIKSLREVEVTSICCAPDKDRWRNKERDTRFSSVLQITEHKMKKVPIQP